MKQIMFYYYMEKIEVLKLEAEYQDSQIQDIEIQEDRQVNDITLRFMTNRALFETVREKPDNKEMHFYRNRLFQLCKILLLNETEQKKYFEINPNFDISKINEDVFFSFDNFIKNAIQNFKVIDTNDLLHEDIFIEEKTYSSSNYVEYPINQKQNTLDSFVVKEKTETIILPVQKKIDLSNPIFRKKGLRKSGITSASPMKTY